MIRFLVAAAAALALLAQPAFACDDCKNCPHAKMAQADTKDAAKPDPAKKDGKATPGCPCASSKDCKCGEKCDCPNCHQKAEKKEEKKS